MQFRVIWPDGSIHGCTTKDGPYFDAQNRPLYVTGACVEITAQKQIEAALRESSERFRTMADHISQLAWMAEADGHIFWYNRRWFEYTGTTLDTVQGSGWMKVHHPDHLERVLERWWRYIRAGEPWEDTFPLLGADGNYRWFLSRAGPDSGRTWARTAVVRHPYGYYRAAVPGDAIEFSEGDRERAHYQFPHRLTDCWLVEGVIESTRGRIRRYSNCAGRCHELPMVAREDLNSRVIFRNFAMQSEARHYSPRPSK
jgi:PAS domain S-box-containing protein